MGINVIDKIVPKNDAFMGLIDNDQIVGVSGGFLDENDMSSDLDNAFCSQQSIKAYVDDSIGSIDLAGSYVPYSGANSSVNLGSYALTAGSLLTDGDLYVNEIGLSNNTTGSAGCSLIGIPAISGATVSNQCEFNTDFGGTGRRTGGEITDNTGGYVTVAAGTGYIKSSDVDTDELLAFNWAENASVEITQAVTFIGVKYNGGSPEIAKYDSYYDFDLDSEFMLGAVYRMTVNSSYTYCIMNTPWWVTDGMTNLIERSYADGKVVRDASVGGMTISNPATTKLAITGGTVWSLLTEYPITAIDTSVPTGSFYLMWYASADGWQADFAAVDYSVDNYNDITENTLQSIGNNQYANIWVYACPGPLKYVLLYPQAYYSNSGSAEAESPPTFVPDILKEEGLLIGRLLIKEGVDAPIEIQSAFDTQFTASQASDHGNLAGLVDDDHTQYALLTGRTGDTQLIDTIDEFTSGSGVTIDGCLIKDGLVADSNLLGGLSGAEYLDRSNHTGSQAVSTIYDFTSGVANQIPTVYDKGQISLFLQSSEPITNGEKSWQRVPFDCDIKSWEVTSNISGDIVVDVWKDTYANYPPTSADSIVSGIFPSLTSGTKNSGSDLSNWTTALDEGDYVKFNIGSSRILTETLVNLNIERRQ